MLSHLNSRVLSFASAIAITVPLVGGVASQQASAQAPAAKPAAVSGTLSGKVVWVDLKNSALLVVCETNDGCKDVKGKKGETYTLTIPAALKKDAESWKEGVLVTASFDEVDEGRTLKGISASP